MFWIQSITMSVFSRLLQHLHQLSKSSIILNSWKRRTWFSSFSCQLLQIFTNESFICQISSSTWIAIMTTLWTSCSMVRRAWMWSVLESQLMATPRISCKSRPKWPGSFSTTWSPICRRFNNVRSYLVVDITVTTNLENWKTLTHKWENLLHH